jgi:hypothetical protein
LDIKKVYTCGKNNWFFICEFLKGGV